MYDYSNIPGPGLWQTTTTKKFTSPKGASFEDIDFENDPDFDPTLGFEDETHRERTVTMSAEEFREMQQMFKKSTATIKSLSSELEELRGKATVSSEDQEHMAELEAENKSLREDKESADHRIRHILTRSKGEVAQAHDEAVKSVFTTLLPLLDDIEANEVHGEDDMSIEMKQLIEKFHKISGGLGLRKVPGEVGSEFDPLYHNAILRQPGTDHPEGAIVAVARTGYMTEAGVIRAADVIVAGD